MSKVMELLTVLGIGAAVSAAGYAALVQYEADAHDAVNAYNARVEQQASTVNNICETDFDGTCSAYVSYGTYEEGN